MPITVSNLVATSVANGVQLTYDTVDPFSTVAYLSLDVVEVLAGQDPSFSFATKVTEGDASSALHSGLLAGSTWYYWVQPRDRTGNKGAIFPVGAGVSIKVFSDSDTWIDYLPNIFSTVGTIASYTASGRFKIIGRSCFVTIAANVDPTGGSGLLRASLPFPCDFGNATVGTFIRFNDNAMGSAYTVGAPVTSNTFTTLQLYNGTFPLSVATGINVSLMFELPP